MNQEAFLIAEVEQIVAPDVASTSTLISDTEFAMSLFAQETRMETDQELANRMALEDVSEDEEDIPGDPSPLHDTSHQEEGSPSSAKRAKRTKPWLFRWFNSRTSRPLQLTGQICAVCQDPISDFQFKAPCGDYYDKECLLELFTRATQDESLYPPRCCRQRIPVRKVLPLMSPSDARKFRSKAAEFKTRRRIYCASPTCGRFLGSERKGGWFSRASYPCTACSTTTCAKCNKKYDKFHKCDIPYDEQQVLSLGEQEGWARCPGCGQLIELQMGCYHMTCRCKTQFCYLCKARWKKCDCVRWAEDRLAPAAERRVDLQLGQPAPAPAPALAHPAPAPAPPPARPPTRAPVRFRNVQLHPVAQPPLVETHSAAQTSLDTFYFVCKYLFWIIGLAVEHPIYALLLLLSFVELCNLRNDDRYRNNRL